MTKNEVCEDQFPSVSLAYKIALNSYDVLTKRIDSIDGRLQTVLDGAVKVLDLSKLDTDEWLAKSEWEFKNLMIQAASRAFVTNNAPVTRTGGVLLALLLFFLWGFCLAVW